MVPRNDGSATLSSTTSSSCDTPIVRFHARRAGPRCPFGNDDICFELQPGGCVHLVGPSGLGKTTLANVLSGLSNPSVLKKLDIDLVDCTWDSSIDTTEQCGVLFQQTTLLDDLTVAGNLQLALVQHHDRFPSTRERNAKIKQLLESVGLQYHRDAGKRPTELSGGMARRASLALQLAQQKHVVVLDEPFTGLDYNAGMSVAKELVHLRKLQPQTALLLISHQPHLTQVVMDPTQTRHNSVVELVPPSHQHDDTIAMTAKPPSVFGTTFFDRFMERWLDYSLYSLPLIVMAFVACGLAIAMLSADLLQRLDITDPVLNLVEKEVRPMIQLLTGKEPSALHLMGVRFKVKNMLQQTVPPAKATLLAKGLTQLFVLEVGPLLTALLLCGRIGGSYAGKVGMMQATSQNKLLTTLGVSPRRWTLWPALLAALWAGPTLTVSGTFIALALGGTVAPRYGIGTLSQYWKDLWNTVLPPLRLKSIEPFWEHNEDGLPIPWTWRNALAPLDWNVTYKESSTWMDSIVEIVTYPPVYHLLKAQVFIVIILGVAEVVSRWQPNLSPRGVPSVITVSVVASGLLVILADWAFSQLWLLRH